MNHTLANTIRQQADDLRDELKDLDLWQDEVAKQQESNKKRKVFPAAANLVPPIRGTVPSLKAAMSKVESSVSEDPIKLAKDQGNELFQKGKLGEAIDAYSKGIDLDPEGSASHVLYGNRALCHLKLAKWGEAERDASMCVRLSHGYAKGYYRRALARKQLDDLRGARTDLEAVLALAPNDENATKEMKVVTQLLYEKREQTTKPPAKKKIVIDEVDDEEETDETSNATGVATLSENDAAAAEAAEAAQKRLNEELENAREAQRALQKSRAEAAEAEMSRRRRTDARVEVIDESDCTPVAKKSPTLPTSQSSPQPPLNEEESLKKKNVDRVGSNDAVQPKFVESAQTTKPRSINTISKWSKETLKAPKSFTEFERIFADIANNEELSAHYVSLITPATLRTLFGSNMTPEILLGILRAVVRLPGSVVVALLKGLCSVRRVEEICLFFDSSEKKVIEDALHSAANHGASSEDVALFKQKLKV